MRTWEDTFKTNPSSLYELLYDLYALGTGQLGKGKRRKLDGSLEELWRIVYREEETV